MGIQGWVTYHMQHQRRQEHYEGVRYMQSTHT